MDSIVTDTITSKILDYMGIESSFLNNINIMALLIFLIALCIGLFFIVSKLALNKTLA